MQEIADGQIQLNESQIYDEIIGKLQEAKENGIPLEEGLLGGLIGGVAGATFGPSVMKAVCKALGIDERGPLGSLMTSRLILTAVGAKVGW
jgi:hypothetical protein